MKYTFTLLLVFLLLACGNKDNKHDTTIEPIELNTTGITSEIDEPLFYQQWALEQNNEFYTSYDIDSEAHLHGSAYYDNFTGKGVTVAIIDNGFDVTHPEINNRVIATLAVDSDGNILGKDVSHTASTDYHGTAVAGIIAAAQDGEGIRGIVPNVALILIRMPVDITEASEIIMFQKAVELGADIINCSWGTYNVSQTVRDLINTIVQNGTTVIFAAGNNARRFSSDEASIKNVIAVGATAHNNLRINYSNYGPELDIVAPGGFTYGISTIDPQGDLGASLDQYNRFNELRNNREVSFIGTSAAAPLVSGAIAMALEKDPTLSSLNLLEKIKYSTDHIGETPPYLDEMISSSSPTPTITGTLGASSFSDLSIYLRSHDSDIQYGPYHIEIENQNRFSATATDTLPEGFYTIEVQNTSTQEVYATDELFEINRAKNNASDSSLRKNDYYGYGKLNIDKLMNNI